MFGSPFEERLQVLFMSSWVLIPWVKKQRKKKRKNRGMNNAVGFIFFLFTV